MVYIYDIFSWLFGHKVPFFAEWNIGSEKELQIKNQLFKIYKMVPISIIMKKLAEFEKSQVWLAYLQNEYTFYANDYPTSQSLRSY